MDPFVRKVALLVKEKEITISEGTKLTNDYLKLHDEVTSINRKFEKLHKREHKEERKELLERLGETKEKMEEMDTNLQRQIPQLIRKG
ncbi:MAG: hypothetical protein KGH65_02885 [Candidatus Micrarchaeota archaeon]|nr:hypothetical protein [Candidatus Micrarchaeota archaeon]